MLIDELINYCDNQYSSQDTKHLCDNCNHPYECSGSCKDCLKQIHYPEKNPYGKKDYDCDNLINFYVCDYSYKYASEILYLMRKSKLLPDIQDYKIVSLGCGCCPDLMAFEEYVRKSKKNKSIKYFGVDRNEHWDFVHKAIKKYCINNNISVKFFYKDIIQYFNEGKKIKNANVLIMQYVISYFYNTRQIRKIENFFDAIVDQILSVKSKNDPFVILISDVNSSRRGRDFFERLYFKIKEAGYKCTFSKFYFNYRIVNDNQRYGNMHLSNDILFNMPDQINKYDPWTKCSSAQMIIEIE